jgi:hypothetical protein
MDERLRFVARLREGEKMAPLCAEFGISRKTGYKIFARYKSCGQEALTDRSRRPYRQANRLPAPIEATIVRLKYPGWGAPKIREKLRQQSTALHLPAISTVGSSTVDSRVGIPPASCHTTWDTSITRRAGSNRSRIPSGRKCYLCRRNKPSPM